MEEEIKIKVVRVGDGAAIEVGLTGGISLVNAIGILEVAKQKIINRMAEEGITIVSRK